MTRRRRLAFAVLLGCLLLVPLAMIGLNEYALATGDHVLLRVEPVDPDDPFRGEYVALSYEITRARVEPGARDGETVYVPLVKQDLEWRGSSAFRTKPDSGTFIRGQVQSGVIRYGIETYYVEEGTAREYEQAIVRRQLYAEVVLDDDGGARLDGLRIVRR